MQSTFRLRWWQLRRNWLYWKPSAHGAVSNAAFGVSDKESWGIRLHMLKPAIAIIVAQDMTQPIVR